MKDDFWTEAHKVRGGIEVVNYLLNLLDEQASDLEVAEKLNGALQAARQRVKQITADFENGRLSGPEALRRALNYLGAAEFLGLAQEQMAQEVADGE